MSKLYLHFIQIQHVVVFATKWLETLKIKWLEKPEYKCLSQIQNKFKAASCNVCIKDINISNIGGRVDKLSFLKYGNTHLINELYYKIGR
jgi:hypothetical protein